MKTEGRGEWYKLIGLSASVLSGPKGTLSREEHKTFSTVLTTFTGAASIGTEV